MLHPRRELGAGELEAPDDTPVEAEFRRQALVPAPRLRMAGAAGEELQAGEVAQPREGAQQRVEALPRLRLAEVENVAVRRVLRTEMGEMEIGAVRDDVHLRLAYAEVGEEAGGRTGRGDDDVRGVAAGQLRRPDLGQRRRSDRRKEIRQLDRG